jgi:hypothetical protein
MGWDGVGWGGVVGWAMRWVRCGSEVGKMREMDKKRREVRRGGFESKGSSSDRQGPSSPTVYLVVTATVTNPCHSELCRASTQLL